MAVHPLIGQAIISTIAMACAKDEGFDVVTDDGSIHYEIIEADVESIYRSLLHANTPELKKYSATERELCELIVFQQCDVAKLTPKGLAALGQDRDAIDAFRGALADLAAKIPEMYDKTAFDERLQDGVSDALRAWKKDRMNMSNISKSIFGREILKPTEDVVKSIVEKFAPPAIGAVGAAAGGADAPGVLLGAAAGFIVALLFHSVTSIAKVSERARESPYRYLTKIEKHGVAFTMTK